MAQNNNYHKNYKPNNYKNAQKQRAIKQQNQLDAVRKYQANLSKLTMSDIKKKETITYSEYTKSNYRTYIKNPSTNEAKIRDMSNFLYRVSTPYKRIIKYFSDIPMFYWDLIPDMSNKSLKNLKEYRNLLNYLNNMNISSEMRKALVVALREGAFYGFTYEDENSFFIHQLDSDYCRIIEEEAGCYNFAFDFAYFDKHKTYVDYLDPTFKAQYELYKSNSSEYKWQLLDPKRSICIKADPDNTKTALPFFVGIFEDILDLIDARTLQRNKDEIQNYKLIYQKIPRFSDTKDVDDFSVDVDTALKFYNTLVEVVPDAVGVAMSPLEIDTVDFKKDDDSSDLITSYMRSVYNNTGVSEFLFNANKTGTDALVASITTDVALIWSIVEQIENWIRRYISYKASGKNKYFFNILRVDIFNKDKACEAELKLANSGVPNKLKLAATSGINPYELMSAQYFENEILKVHEGWIPLQTSYTLSKPPTSPAATETIEDPDGGGVDE